MGRDPFPPPSSGTGLRVRANRKDPFLLCCCCCSCSVQQKNIASSGHFGRTPLLASTAPATLRYALRARYPTAMPRFISVGHPIANERLEDQRRFAALCDYVSRRRSSSRGPLSNMAAKSTIVAQWGNGLLRSHRFAPPVHYFRKGRPSPHKRQDVVHFEIVCRRSCPAAALPMAAA